jgi:HAD superfamily hydrolase (TIGR01484 family)
LIEKAISHYNLPQPDFVVGDVGTSIYHVGTEQDWQRQIAWEKEIAGDWENKSHADLKELLLGIKELRLQGHTKQNKYKLSYYIPLQSDQDSLSALIRERLSRVNVRASLIWSVDEPNGIGLLDILPERATKFHAVESLMKEHKFDLGSTVFCGDSGNDIEVMASAIPAVLVANSQADVKQLARKLADINGYGEQLYVAQGNFMGMNGNYAAGMLEGIAHYYPETIDWMGFDDQRSEYS